MSSRSILPAALLALALAAPAASADTSSLRLVTDGTFGADPADAAKLVRVSDDGSRVFFHTTEVMAASDTDAMVDAYVRIGSGAPVHLTDNPLAPDKPVNTFLSLTSPDGTRAYFSSEENLAPTDTDTDTADAYERTPNGALVHLSDNAMGADFDNVPAFVQAVTPDGRHVYFATPEPLMASDTDAAADVYERGPAGLVHVSDGPGPDAAGFAVTFKRASDDGARVYFETNEKLVAADTDNARDVYQRTAAGVVLVSDDPTGPDADNMEAQFLDVTPDGARVLFETRESLAATDTDTVSDVYERAPSGALTHITRDPSGPENGFNANYAGRSSDGTRVAFSTQESMATTDTDAASDVYVRQPGGTLIHVTDGPGPDGNLNAATFAVSADATRVVFATSEPLAPTDTDTTADGYLRLPGALVHVTDDPTGADDATDAVVQYASADLARIVFTTKERLAPTDTDTAYDLYERVADGTLVHLSDDPTGPDANIDAVFERLSTDLRRVYFTTDESLSSADTDAVADGYLATLVPDRPATPRPRPPAIDTTAPALTRLRAVPRRSRVRFQLSEPATVRLVVRRRGARARSVSLAGQAGTNSARVRIRARGRYRVTAVATDAAGNRSAARRIGFRVRGRE